MTTASVTSVEVGMPATLCIGSDRYPATVRSVSYFKSGARVGEVRSVIVQQDSVSVVGGTWPDLEYSFAPDPNGAIHLFFADRNGRLNNSSMRLTIGERRRYNDPHF